MNKNQIKAELRRSACEDKDITCGLNHKAWRYMIEEGYRKLFSDFDNLDDWRTFYLLVSEDIE